MLLKKVPKMRVVLLRGEDRPSTQRPLLLQLVCCSQITRALSRNRLRMQLPRLKPVADSIVRSKLAQLSTRFQATALISTACVSVQSTVSREIEVVEVAGSAPAPGGRSLGQSGSCFALHTARLHTPSAAQRGLSCVSTAASQTGCPAGFRSLTKLSFSQGDYRCCTSRQLSFIVMPCQ